MNDLKKASFIRWFVPLVFIAALIVNYLAQALPFNGQTNGEVSDKYSTLFTPADYAFSIWLIIYTAIGFYALFQLLWASLNNKSYEKLGIWLIAALVLSSAWLPAFQYEKLVLSAVILLLAFFSLTKASLILNRDETIDQTKKLWIKIVFGLYYGWITVATMVNIAVVWKYMFGMVNESTFTIIMLIVGLALSVFLSRIFRNAIISLTIAWGYLAIAFKAGQRDEVFLTAIITGVILILFALAGMYKRQKRV